MISRCTKILRRATKQAAFQHLRINRWPHAKAGISPIADVLKYGEVLKTNGLTLLSAPGNDLIASSALAAPAVKLSCLQRERHAVRHLRPDSEGSHKHPAVRGEAALD